MTDQPAKPMMLPAAPGLCSVCATKHDPMHHGMIAIYELIDPRDNCPRYVGQSVHPERRFSQHIESRDYSNLDKRMWIEEVLRQGCEPQLRIVKWVHPLDADNEEKAHIQLLIDRNVKLLNFADGGNCRSRTRAAHAIPTEWKELGNLVKKLSLSLTAAQYAAQKMCGVKGWKILGGVERQLSKAKSEFENLMFAHRKNMPNGTSVFYGDLNDDE